jgi:integrase
MPTQRKPRGKRRNGEGTVYRYRNDRWSAQVTLPDGRRKGRYFATEEEAWEWVKQASADIARGQFAHSGGMTLERYLADWLLSLEGISDHTRSCYTSRLEHIAQLIGTERLDRVTPAKVRTVYRTLREDQGLSPSTLHDIHTSLKRAMKDAAGDHLIAESPCARLTVPRRKTHEMQALTREQVQTLIDSTKGQHLHALWVLLPFTGLRIGEAEALRWQDVDLTAGEVTVIHTRRAIPGGGTELGPVKSHGSHRKVVLAPIVVRALMEQRKTSRSDLVFTNTRGGPLTTQTTGKWLHRALERANLPDIRVHDLRHTAATLLLAMGTHPKVVAEMLGHTDPGFTYRVYSHVTQRMHQDAVHQLESWVMSTEPLTKPLEQEAT